MKPVFSRLSAAMVGLSLLLLAMPASAHHAMGGRLPNNFFEGFLAGLAHPVIGLDHFAFVVAVGLLASLKRQGFWVPVAFVGAALAGTGLHLLKLDLPLAEIFVAVSVLLMGSGLALPKSPNLGLMVTISAIAGVFHGYAYGESIVGAESTALVAYLLGFTAIQCAIALGGFKLAGLARHLAEQTPVSLRFVGFTICGVGATFLASHLGL